MEFLEKLFNKLFDKKGKSPVQVMEPLKRSENYRHGFENWKRGSDAPKIIKAVERSYYLKKDQIKGEYEVHLFESAAANGFALMHHPALQPPVLQYLLDFWRDRVLILGYRLANTDRQIRERGNVVETIEKHYLKPPLSQNQPQAVQRFGNILLEYVLINQEPAYLKLMVTTYSDRLFTEAQPFDDLLDQLFSME